MEEIFRVGKIRRVELVTKNDVVVLDIKCRKCAICNKTSINQKVNYQLITKQKKIVVIYYRYH